MKRLYLLLCIVCCLVYHAGLFAQRLPLIDYSIRFPELRNGAISLFQDSRGWIWIATGYAVMRYDGYQWQNIPPANKVEIDFCYQVLEVNGSLMVKSRPYNLLVEGDSLHIHPELANEKMVEATSKYQGRQYLLNEQGLKVLAAQSWQTIIPAQIHQDLDNNLLPFKNNLLLGNLLRDSLLVFDLNQQQLHRLPVTVRDMAISPKGDIFLLVENELWQLDSLVMNQGEWKIRYRVLANIPYTLASRMIATDQGQVWISANRIGLFCYDQAKGLRQYGEADGLPGLGLQDIFHDREDNIWITLVNSIVKIPGDRANIYNSADGLPYNNIGQLLYYPDGDVMLGLSPKGLALYAGGKWTALKSRGQPILASRMRQMGNALFISHGKELFRLQLPEAKSTEARLLPIANLPGRIEDMAMDQHGTIWACTSQELFSVEGSATSVSSVRFTQPLKTLYIDSADRLWAGEFGGEIHGYHFVRAANNTSLQPLYWMTGSGPSSLRAVRSYALDKQGRLLVGTRYDGIFRLTVKGDTVQQTEPLSDTRGGPAQPVWEIAVDKDNRYWLAGEGLAVVNGNTGKMLTGNAALQYGISRCGAVCISKADTIWVATPNGLVAFDPFSPVTTKVPLATHITGVWMNEHQKWDSSEGNIHLPYDNNNLLISFSSNSFRHEELIKYSYTIMADNDISWSQPSTEHMVRFRALAPGRYLFRVKAWDSEGRLLPGEAQLPIVVLAPFYRSWWFFGLMMLVFAIIIYSIYRYRLAQFKKLMLVRLQIAENLHDDIGASLTNIMLLNEMARSQLHEPEATKPLLQRSVEDIRRISESLSDIVWNINPRNDAMPQLMARMNRYAGEMMEGAGIDATWEVDEHMEQVKLGMAQRRDLFLVFKEMIHNMVRHSRATAATIYMRVNGNTLQIKVEDNGRGFMPEEIDAGNGLSNMQQRVRKWGGAIAVESRPGAGTSISFSWPLAAQ